MGDVVSVLEQRRLAARAHDDRQRAAEAAEQRRQTQPPPAPALPTRVRVETPQEDALVTLLAGKDGRSLATIDDLRVLFRHLESRLDDLDSDFFADDKPA